jgi:hypothetical protein
MKCHFCWDETETPQITKEHLLSVPVADAFGIDRASSAFARFDEDAVRAGDLSGLTWTSLGALSVRIACAPCNNGWMNDLEHAMVEVAGWNKRGDRPLGAANVETLRRWLLKTYVVLSVMDGGTRRFIPTGDGEIGFSVMPEITRASQLRRGDQAAFDGVVVGLARTNSDAFFYAFGNPTVIPKGPEYANARSAGVAALTLRSLQVWIVVPWFRHATTRLPRGVTLAHTQLRANRLQSLPAKPDTLAPVVDNGEHDIAELMAKLQEWAGAEQARHAKGPRRPRHT